MTLKEKREHLWSVRQRAAEIAEEWRAGILVRDLRARHRIGKLSLYAILLSQIPRQEYDRLTRQRRLERLRDHAAKFQPGNKRWKNRKRATGTKPLPVGTIRARRHRISHRVGRGRYRVGQRLFIKVALSRQPREKNWMLYSRWLWEKHHGPIPAGYRVVFRDGDRLHCEIGNLNLISEQDAARRIAGRCDTKERSRRGVATRRTQLEIRRRIEAARAQKQAQDQHNVEWEPDDDNDWSDEEAGCESLARQTHFGERP